MTVRLLTKYGNLPPNSLLTTAAATEAELLRTGQADRNVSLGTTYDAPPNERMYDPVSLIVRDGVATLFANRTEFGTFTIAQTAASSTDLDARGLTYDIDYTTYLRTDRRFVDTPAAYTYANRWTQNPAANNLWDEVTGAVAVATAAPTIAAHPAVVSRSARVYNGSTQYDTLPAGSFPYDMNQKWSVFALWTPNVTRSGASTVNGILNNQLIDTTFRGIDLAVGWNNGSSTTIAAVTISDDFTANKYVQFTGSTDLANGTSYVIGLHCNPDAFDGTNQYSKFQVTINGALAVGTWGAGASQALMATIAGASQPTVGANTRHTKFTKGALASLAVFGQYVAIGDAGLIVKTARGVGKSNILLSVDNAGDISDLAAVKYMCALATSGTADLVGVVTDSANAFSAPSVKAVLNYYGMPWVPVIAWQGATPAGAPSVSTFTQTVRDAFVTTTNPNGIVNALGTDRTDAQYSTAIVVNGAAAASPDAAIAAVLNGCAAASVHVCMTGFAGPMSAAVTAAAATFGTQVLDFNICMGHWGPYFEGSGTEFNARNDVAAWNSLFATLPATVPVYLHSIALGNSTTSKPWAGKNTAIDPGALAWQTSRGSLTTTYFAWDSATLLMAIARPALLTKSDPGMGTVGSTGFTVLNQSVTPNQHFYMTPRTSLPDLTTQLNGWLATYHTTWLP